MLSGRFWIRLWFVGQTKDIVNTCIDVYKRQRLFTPVSYTQRPAAASAKLCEGRIVVLVNGSPSAMVLPALFCENFECLDDYASTAVFASFLRVLNYASFYLTVFLPGAFVCLAVYLPELIPPQLLYKICLLYTSRCV